MATDGPKPNVRTVYISERFRDVWETTIQHSSDSGLSVSAIVGEALLQYLTPSVLERGKARELFAQANGHDDEEEEA